MSSTSRSCTVRQVCRFAGRALVLACCLGFAEAAAVETTPIEDPLAAPSRADEAGAAAPIGVAGPLELAATGFRFTSSTLECARWSGSVSEAGPSGTFSLFPDLSEQDLPTWPPPSKEATTLTANLLLSGVRNVDRPYRTKVFRGVLLVTGVELVSGVALAFLPQNFSRWDEDPYGRAAANLKRAWSTPPVWDRDVFFHNWIGHPYAGAFYYNMVRSQGATRFQSFGFALLETVLWEYFLEAMAEQPSIQDLFTTPVAGSILGELFHSLSLRILRKGPLNLGQKVIVFLLNPAYVVNNGFRRPE